MRFLSSFQSPTIRDLVEYVLANRRSKAPKKRLTVTKDRDFEASANKEPPLIHDALVGANHCAQIAVLALQVRIHVGKISRKAQGCIRVRLTTRCASPSFAVVFDRAQLSVVHQCASRYSRSCVKSG